MKCQIYYVQTFFQVAIPYELLQPFIARQSLQAEEIAGIGLLNLSKEPQLQSRSYREDP